MTDKKSPWTALLDKLAGVLIEAVDEGVAAAKRKASAPPPNVVPIRPVDQAAEIELLKAEVTALHFEIDRLHILAEQAKKALGPLAVTSAEACRALDYLRAITSSHRKDTAT